MLNIKTTCTTNKKLRICSKLLTNDTHNKLLYSYFPAESELITYSIYSFSPPTLVAKCTHPLATDHNLDNIISQTNEQTDRQTYSSQYFATRVENPRKEGAKY